MRLPSSLAALLLLPLLAFADEFDASPKNARIATVSAWPLSAATPTPLAEVSYNPRSSAGGSYAPIATGDGKVEELVRVGVSEDKGWSIVAPELVGRKDGVKVTLRVDRAGDVWGVEITEDKDAVGAPKVEVFRSEPGAVPALNKPIVLNPDGKVPVPEVEKTFLQKYWWVILAGMVLLVGGGGGSE
ncbi:hypothetical protein FN846DRAFT_887216 [Sphaerosporella brunnea]|uniref:ER membrane protein complex subunit 10 n=1 Tax=Sphaerosporella brunnea TaxID=1250544 RepID=A0A5J5F776_9PEZI|nr:hypothetical protein FN846DRAFT_887216 [Sphaerosporella brunnea]